MDNFYAPTVRDIRAWAGTRPDVMGVVLLGSQVRRESSGDRWSDLDLLVFIEDPRTLIEDDGWLSTFGRPVCITKEDIPLDSMGARWYVKRPLYDDFRALDISILASGLVDTFLKINAEIHSHGYEVILDRGGVLERKIAESIRSLEAPGLPEVTEDRYRDLVNDLLYHVIWAFKKIMRGELWSAVSCVNCYMKGTLLALMEMHNAVVTRRASPLMFDGRLLESRIHPRILGSIRGCFARYEEGDVPDALANYVDAVELIAEEISRASGFSLPEKTFQEIRAMYGKMIGWHGNA